MNAQVSWVPGLRLNLLRSKNDTPQSANPGGVGEAETPMTKRKAEQANEQEKSNEHETLRQLEEIKRLRDNKEGPLYRLEALRTAKRADFEDFQTWHMPRRIDEPRGAPVSEATVARRKRESATLNTIRALLNITHEALGKGDWVQLDRVAHAARGMGGLHFSQNKIAWALACVEQALSLDGEPDSEVLAILITQLEAIDVRFDDAWKLEALEILKRAHLVASNEEANRKGGRGHRGARGALAELARLCGALDVSEIPDFDQAIANAVKASNRRKQK